jgi:hypothetical protein
LWVNYVAASCHLNTEMSCTQGILWLMLAEEDLDRCYNMHRHTAGISTEYVLAVGSLQFDTWVVPTVTHVRHVAYLGIEFYIYIYIDSLQAGQCGDRIPVGGRDFTHRSRSALGRTHLPVQWEQFLFPRSKAVGAWPWPPTPSSAEVKERVELHPSSSSGPSWQVIEWTVLFNTTHTHHNLPQYVM